MKGAVFGWILRGAGRIPGITPADVQLLWILLEKRVRTAPTL